MTAVLEAVRTAAGRIGAARVRSVGGGRWGERLAALCGFAAIAAVTVVSAGAGLAERRPVDEVDRALAEPSQLGDLLRAWCTHIEETRT
ncbi:hypothetical protein [Streptomyces sp. AA4]|uniref:hypothetical protein n=1 Tax=Streptomyces sp. AA4 TaxID=591158 RepID=UPI002570429D|nr:hypothetical protein [Streptomyces sp. AA4]